jgi:outer membrane receptor for ferrienterochelin and colicin
MRKNILLTIISLIAWTLGMSFAFAQGSTTSAISGVVKDNKGESIPGVNVVAIHEPTGTKFGTVTNENGQFSIRNMNVGGPYKITATFVGYKPAEQSNIFLSLGVNTKVNFDIQEEAVTTEDVVVTGVRDSYMNGERTGATTPISLEQINQLPTVSRSLSDFTRLTPQANVDRNGGVSIAGMNNRYNSIFIDGAVNNDVFGLSAQGTNGGQTGISPISIDAIEAFEVVLAPFDVRQGGFAGGGINAVTRSGKNKVEGSAYFFNRNQNLAGVTPSDILPDDKRVKLAKFSAKTYGFRVGGPIIKDKLFFFINSEIQRDQTPQPFNLDEFNDKTLTRERINSLTSKLNGFGYNPGGFENNTNELRGEKFLVRLDYNISDKHKLTFRHSYTRGLSINATRSSASAINFYNRAITFPSTTNSTALELKSNFKNSSNNLILGYTNVLDDRNGTGSPFPAVTIRGASGTTINFGTEPFSNANQLKQGIFTLTNNFTMYKGKHSITLGTHNEFYNMYNLFIRQNFGAYTFASLDDFLNDKPALTYDRSYSLVDKVTGDGSAAAAEFKAMQLGFYAQDEIQVTDKLLITAGLRFDMPIFNTDARRNPRLANSYQEVLKGSGGQDSIVTRDPQFKAITDFGYDLSGVEPGKMPKTQVMVSPRLGFNYDVKGDQSFIIRGGAGIFTSRVPFVWPAGMYTNNGITVGGIRIQNTQVFVPDPFNQPGGAPADLSKVVPNGQIDLFAANFKYPQVARLNLAFEKKLPGGIIASLEGIYTKTLNNVYYQNVNVRYSKDANGKQYTLTGTPDNRPIFFNPAASSQATQFFHSAYSPGIYIARNTNQGYTYNVTASVRKSFKSGIDASLAYTYGRAYSIFDGTSSQNSSQWRFFNQVNGRNNAQLGISDFDLGSRIVGAISYRKEYGKFFATQISLFYNGQSGARMSYVYNDLGALTREDASSNNLIFVPAKESDIRLVDVKDANGNVTLSAAQQWKDLNEFIESDKYLSKRRGDYAERNGARLPFFNIFDIRILQDFTFTTSGGRKHTLQLSLDLFNFGNFINKDWGRRYFATSNNVALIDFVRFEKDTTTGLNTVPTFVFRKPNVNRGYNVDDSGFNSSRWQAQIGVRYIF